MLRGANDVTTLTYIPEKPETLEELLVVQEDLVDVCENTQKPGTFTTHIQFVPTVPHCSLATLIGLCIRTKLDQELPKGLFKIDLAIKVSLILKRFPPQFSPVCFGLVSTLRPV